MLTADLAPLQNIVCFDPIPPEAYKEAERANIKLWSFDAVLKEVRRGENEKTGAGRAKRQVGEGAKDAETTKGLSGRGQTRRETGARRRKKEQEGAKRG
jgi:hypothetical protein